MSLLYAIVRYLFFSTVVESISPLCDLQVDQVVILSRAECCLDLYPRIRRALTRLHTSRAFGAVRTDILNVNRSSNDLDVLEGELGALSDYEAVDKDHGTSIVIQAISIASLLVRV